MNDLDHDHSRSVFIKPFTLRKGNHFGNFSSDAERVTNCWCSCEWTTNGVDALDVLNDFRQHVQAEVA